MPITLLSHNRQIFFLLLLFLFHSINLSISIQLYNLWGRNLSLTLSQLKLVLIFLNIKCFISKHILSFGEVKIIYSKLLMTKIFYSVQGKCLQELWILWVLRPGNKGSYCSIQLNFYSITFFYFHWNLYKLARTLITQRLQGNKLFQDFSRSIDLGSIGKKIRKKGKAFLKTKPLVFQGINVVQERFLFP